MVPKWLNPARRKKTVALQGELPPIIVTPSASGSLPHYSFATISLFQNVKNSGACINRFGLSTSGETVHLAFLTPSVNKKSASACQRIAHDCWLQLVRDEPEWLESTDAVARWLVMVQKSLTNFGGGTLSSSVQGITLDQRHDAAFIYLNGLAGALLIQKDDTIKYLAPTKETGLIGDLKNSPPTSQKISTTSLKAIVLASDDFQKEHVEKGIKKILPMQYPKTGVAELLFYELQKTGNGSSVLWIEML